MTIEIFVWLLVILIILSAIGILTIIYLLWKLVEFIVVIHGIERNK